MSEYFDKCNGKFKLTDNARRITHPLVGLSLLSRCDEAQYAKVAKVDEFGVPSIFKTLLDGSFAVIH